MENDLELTGKESRNRKFLKRIKSADIYFLGEEPEIEFLKTDSKEVINQKACRLFNWYSHTCDSTKPREWIIEYAKTKNFSKQDLQCINSASNYNNTAGWIARILLREVKNVPKKFVQFLNDTLEKMKLDGVNNIERYQNKITQLQHGRQRALQAKEEKVKALTNEYIGEFEYQLDQFILNKCNSTFDVYQYLSEKKVTQDQSKMIGEYYSSGIYSELLETKKKTDEQLVEAYDFLSAAKLQKYIDFVKLIIDSCDRWSTQAPQKIRSTRKPRAKKVKTASQLIKKLQFQEKCDTFNLYSVQPEKVIGALQLWIFNTKYRYLGVYNACDSAGFSVKGSSLKNFNSGTSIEKKLRKPNEVLKTVLEGGKVALRKVLTTVRCKERKLTGRINKHTILLRVE